MHFGRLAKFAGQLEGDGSGKLAEFQVGWNLEGNVLELEIVF